MSLAAPPWCVIVHLILGDFCPILMGFALILGVIIVSLRHVVDSLSDFFASLLYALTSFSISIWVIRIPDLFVIDLVWLLLLSWMDLFKGLAFFRLFRPLSLFYSMAEELQALWQRFSLSDVEGSKVDVGEDKYWCSGVGSCFESHLEFKSSA